MKSRHLAALGFLAALLAVSSFGGPAGCGGGSSQAAGTGSGNGKTDSLTSMNSSFDGTSSHVDQMLNDVDFPALTTALVSKDQIIEHPVSRTFTDSSGGTAAYNGTVSGSHSAFTFGFSGSLSRYSGLSGSFNLKSGHGSRTAVAALTEKGQTTTSEETAFDYEIDGELSGNGCTITFSSLTMSSTYIGDQLTGATVNGGFSAGCTEQDASGADVSIGVTCLWESVDVTDQTMMADGCICEGNLCG